ncbi:MAG: hypothetical protein ABSC62_09890 [Terracidiphilus sp.]
MNVFRRVALKPTEETKRHVISTYVRPARLKGEKTIQVRVGNVQKELGWTNRTPSVFSTLSSKEFQQEAGVELIEKRGGPASGGPSTTWQFVFRVLGEDEKAASQAKATPTGSGLLALYGLCADTFKALGGGEEFLRREREWGPDVWERYQQEELERRNKEAAK